MGTEGEGAGLLFSPPFLPVIGAAHIQQRSYSNESRRSQCLFISVDKCGYVSDISATSFLALLSHLLHFVSASIVVSSANFMMHIWIWYFGQKINWLFFLFFVDSLAPEYGPRQAHMYRSTEDMQLLKTVLQDSINLLEQVGQPG